MTRKKKSEYVLNERTMRQTLTALGTEGTTLLVRGETADSDRRLTGPELMTVVDALNKLEELVKIVQRRGIDFADFLAQRDVNGRLPSFRVVVDGAEHFFHNADGRDTFLVAEHLVEDEVLAEVKTDEAELKAKPPSRLQVNQELHETKDLERLFAQLKGNGLDIDDYYLTQEEGVTGEKLGTRYALVVDDRTTDVAGVSQIVPAIHTLAKHGIEVKRFKGLGEMNSDELWETTLDPRQAGPTPRHAVRSRRSRADVQRPDGRGRRTPTAVH